MKNRVKELRKKSNLTTEELSKRTGILRSSITQIETGKRKLNIRIAQALANYFNVSIDYLRGESLADRFKKILNDLQRDYTYIDEWSPIPQIKEDEMLNEKEKEMLISILKLNMLTLENIKKVHQHIDELYNNERKITLEDFDD